MQGNTSEFLQEGNKTGKEGIAINGVREARAREGKWDLGIQILPSWGRFASPTMTAVATR